MSYRNCGRRLGLNKLKLTVAKQQEALAAPAARGAQRLQQLAGSFLRSRPIILIRAIIFARRHPWLARWPVRGMIAMKAATIRCFAPSRNWPSFRGAARWLTTSSPIAVGVLNSLTNYVIGTGFHYAVSERAAAAAGASDPLVSMAGAVLDEFFDENDWLGNLDRELFQRPAASMASIFSGCGMSAAAMCRRERSSPIT